MPHDLPPVRGIVGERTGEKRPGQQPATRIESSFANYTVTNAFLAASDFLKFIKTPSK